LRLRVGGKGDAGLQRNSSTSREIARETSAAGSSRVFENSEKLLPLFLLLPETIGSLDTSVIYPVQRLAALKREIV
jgi:hypothetical protein